MERQLVNINIYNYGLTDAQYPYSYSLCALKKYGNKNSKYALLTSVRSIEYFLKRILDVTGASVLLFLLMPFMLLVAFAIVCDSSGGVFYTQKRHGKGERVFHLYKFRSMTCWACMEKNGKQAHANDPRITRIGRILRRTSIDELPQLWNVIKGDMSLVGPRPLAVHHNEYFEKYIDNYKIRHAVTPGITGWAQVTGYRGETPTIEHMHNRILLDIEYIANWSLWFDIKILFLTLGAVIFPKNAC